MKMVKNLEIQIILSQINQIMLHISNYHIVLALIVYFGIGNIQQKLMDKLMI